MPTSARSASTFARKPSCQAQHEVVAGGRDAELSGFQALERDAPAEADRSLAEADPGQDVVEPDAAAAEGDSAVDVLEGVRKRQVAERPPVTTANPSTRGVASGPRISAISSTRPELRTSRTNPCRIARFALPRAVTATRSFGRSTEPVRSSSVFSPTSCHALEPEVPLVQFDSDRTVVAEA